MKTLFKLFLCKIRLVFKNLCSFSGRKRTKKTFDKLRFIPHKHWDTILIKVFWRSLFYKKGNKTNSKDFRDLTLAVVGGLIVLTGCSAEMEATATAVQSPTEIPAPLDDTSTEVQAVDQAEAQPPNGGTYIFYNSFASW